MKYTPLLLCLFLSACSFHHIRQESEPAKSVQTKPEAHTEPETQTEKKDPDYLVLINANSDPKDEIALLTSNLKIMKTQYNDDPGFPLNDQAMDAFVSLQDALYEQGIFIEPVSAIRSKEEKHEISQEILAEFDDETAKKHESFQNFDEHDSGLAVDIAYILDAKLISDPVDLLSLQQMNETIAGILPDYGFIIRYPENKEEITGVMYSPWHLRYVKDPETAHEIMDNHLCLEEYLK